MTCRLCKGHAGSYPGEDGRIVLAYGRELRSYAHLACYMEKKGRPAAEKWFGWQPAWRLRSLVDQNAAELRELGLFEFASALAQERERLVAGRNKPGTPTVAQLDLAIEIAEGLQKGVAVRKKPGDRTPDGEVLTAEDIAKAEGIVALGYGIAELLQKLGSESTFTREPENSLEETPEKKDTPPTSRSFTTTSKNGKLITTHHYDKEGGIAIIGVDGYHKAWEKK
jgi:hypothetical protein